jgi:hypothetical protein
MILVDMNQTMISNLMSHIKINNDLDENFMRHLVLNSIKSYEKKFSPKFGELVLCYDSKKYWRREFFPYYKHNRKKDREKSGLDWGSIFECLNKIRDEIKELFPYKVVEVEGAEADDVISVLCNRQVKINIELQKNNKTPEQILILSGDKDFIQLHKHPFVKQYNPVLRKYIDVSKQDVILFVNEHILKGDRSDGIPNYLSSDDTFVTNTRQKPLSKKVIELFLTGNADDICNEDQLKNYVRNKTLIDFSFIPMNLQSDIINYFESLNISKKTVPPSYFARYNLSDLMPEFCFTNSNLPWLKK